jgi:hypothetical protein
MIETMVILVNRKVKESKEVVVVTMTMTAAGQWEGEVDGTVYL